MKVIFEIVKLTIWLRDGIGIHTALKKLRPFGLGVSNTLVATFLLYF